MNRALGIISAILVCLIACAHAEGGRRPNFSWLSGSSGNAIAAKAKTWEGKYYRAGVSRQCANFVGEIVGSVGIDRPAGHALARNWLKWGRPVSYATMRPGDVIVQWRGSRSGTAGHILIYVGNGQCIHRPTYSKAVSRVSAESCKARILGIRRAK